MTEAIQLSQSLEDYLEVIGNLVRERGEAHSRDIAKKLKVKMPSVTVALRALADKGLVDYQRYLPISLTRTGEKLAADIIRKHEVLRSFFTQVLSIDPAKADAIACRMEHAIGNETTERFLNFVQFIEKCPRAGSDWIRGYEHFCRDQLGTEGCEECIQGCLDDLKENRSREKQPEEPEVSLAELEVGDRAWVKSVKNSTITGKRLLEMGLIPGSHLEVVRVAPLGDPLSIKVKGYLLSLRKDEAMGIRVVREDDLI